MHCTALRCGAVRCSAVRCGAVLGDRVPRRRTLYRRAAAAIRAVEQEWSFPTESTVCIQCHVVCLCACCLSRCGRAAKDAGQLRPFLALMSLHPAARAQLAVQVLSRGSICHAAHLRSALARVSMAVRLSGVGRAQRGDWNAQLGFSLIADAAFCKAHEEAYQLLFRPSVRSTTAHTTAQQRNRLSLQRKNIMPRGR